MATETGSTRRGSPRAIASASKKAREGSLDRVSASLEAAQKALDDLRGDLGRGARNQLKNVQKVVRDAQRDVRKLNKSLRSDLGQIGEAITTGKKTGGARKRPAASGTRRKASGSGTSGARKASSASSRRKTSAKKTGARRKSTRKSSSSS